MTYFDYTSEDFYTTVKHQLLTKGTCVKLNKGDFLCRQGERSSLVGFLSNGCLKYSCYTTKGNERIISFAFTGDLVGSYSSIRNNTPSPFDIVAIESSTLFLIPVSQVDAAIGLDKRIRLSEAIAFKALQETIDYRCKSLMERYQDLTNRFPNIHNQISNRTIASYLGITPESLCRLRKRLLTK